MPVLHPVNLELGDVVTLNSGGPKMTVIEVQDEQIKVAWTDLNDEIEVAWFPRVCLGRLRGHEN